MPGIDNLYVLQTDILDLDVRIAINDAGENIARQVLNRAFIAVTGIRFVKRDLGIHVLDDDVPQDGFLVVTGMAGTGPQEDRVTGVEALDSVDFNILDSGTVNRCDCDSAAIGVVNLDILEFEVAELDACDNVTIKISRGV